VDTPLKDQTNNPLSSRTTSEDIARIYKIISELDIEVNSVYIKSRSYVAKLFSKTKELPESYPLVPIKFIGNFTDDFDSTDNLTGPYKDTGTCSIAASGGYLVFTGTGTGNKYAGDNRGTSLSGLASWGLEIHVTDITAVNANLAGICAAPSPFADGVDFGATGKSSLFFWYQSPGAHRIGYRDSTYSSIVTANLPSKTTPLCLRIEHSADAVNHTFVYKYRWGLTGAFTTLATTTLSRSYYAEWEGLIDFGPYFRPTGAGTEAGEYDKMSVEYTPDVVSDDVYAFIPVSGFASYAANHIYIKKTDGFYYDITPETNMVVFSTTHQRLYRWDGSDWVVYKPFLDSHAYAHEDGGDDEIDVEGLAGVLAEAQIPQNHGISDTTYHAGITADEGDILIADVEGLPATAGVTPAEVQAAAEATAAGDVVDKLNMVMSRLASIGIGDNMPVFGALDLKDEGIVNTGVIAGALIADSQISDWATADGRYDAAGLADTAETNAKAYADGLVSGCGNAIIKTSDEIVNNSNTLQDDDELVDICTIADGDMWEVDIYLIVTGNASGGFKASIVSGTAAIAQKVNWVLYQGGVGISFGRINADDPVISITFGTGLNIDTIHIHALLNNDSGSGNVMKLQWAQISAYASDTTVHANSYVIAKQVKA